MSLARPIEIIRSTRFCPLALIFFFLDLLSGRVHEQSSLRDFLSHTLFFFYRASVLVNVTGLVGLKLEPLFVLLRSTCLARVITKLIININM